MSTMVKRVVQIVFVLGVLLVASAWAMYAKIEASFMMNKVVGEALNLTTEPRAIFDDACRDRDLNANRVNALLAPNFPKAYKGNFVTALQLNFVSDRRATVTALLREVEPYNYFDPGVREGDTIVFGATCDVKDISWDVSGSISESHKQMASRSL